MNISLNTLREFDQFPVAHLKEQLTTTYTTRILFTAYETIEEYKSLYPNIYQALSEVLE